MPRPYLTAFVALWVLALVEGFLIFLILRQLGLQALETAGAVTRDGLNVGTQAPELSGVLYVGDPERTTGRVSSDFGKALVLFTSPDCRPCAAIMPGVNAVLANSEQVRVVVIIPGSDMTAAVAMQQKFSLSQVVVAAEGSSRAFDAYRVRVTPFGFVVHKGLIAAKGTCGSPDLLAALLERGGVTEEARQLEIFARQSIEEVSA